MNATIAWRLVVHVFLAAAILFVAAVAQEKKTPDSRRVETSVDSVSRANGVRLPTIDVPDFVVTGAASIELPSAEKEQAAEDQNPAFHQSSVDDRRRSNVTISERTRERLGESPAPLSAKMTFQAGTFSTIESALWLGRSERDFRYGVNLAYDRSGGFAPHTDYSGGLVSVNGGTSLPSGSGALEGSDLDGTISLGGTTYGFYGSSSPTLKRTNNFLELSAALRQTKDLPFDASAQVRSFTVEDSLQTSELAVSFSLAKEMVVQDLPIAVRSLITFAGISGSQSTSLPLFQATANTQSIDLGWIIMGGGISLFAGSSSGGQSFVKLYPTLQTGVQLNASHRFVAAFEPRVERRSLESDLAENPYRSAASQIRHTDYSGSGRFAFESVWSQAFSSRVSMSVQSIHDYPLLVDSAGSGFWQNLYTGTVTRTTFRVEMFAKFGSFDYFASSLSLNLSKNSTTGETLPYVPRIEIGAAYTRVIDARWRIETSLIIVGAQETALTAGNSLPRFSTLNVRSTYAITDLVSAQVSVRNLANDRAERWKGYQEFPFVLSAGVSLNW